MPTKRTKKSSHHCRKYFFWIVGGLVGLTLVALLAFRLSPWPGAMVIRLVFNRGGHKTLVGLQKDIPAQPVTVLANQRYGKNNSKEFLDVYIPQSAIQAHQTLPVVVWTHGGAWLSGDKKGAAPYYNLLADQGFVVISLNYSLAPEKTYPTPVRQLNDAYAYIQANAARFHADTNKIVLAGDSAGAQLSSQMAAIITNQSYANEMGITPALTPSQLSGVVLFCGIYKMEGLTETSPTLPKIVSWGSDVSVWAYIGTRDKSSPLVRQASAYYHATKDFPATFISGGNADPLTNVQSVPFASELQSLNVPVTTLFYPQNYTPALPHEYQFKFDSSGQKAFTAMVQFLKAKTQ
ncbi:MAG TPA: alpha/beta hydrolase [Patescibacteria group bacterium]|nr:alpha/beta hydrolase [Patescibacteria group bacterium]